VPDPFRTSLMSARRVSTVRHLGDETDLRRQHRVAAYFVISADSASSPRNGRSVRRNGAQLGSTSPTSGLRTPTTRVGLHEVVDRRAFLQELGLATSTCGALLRANLSATFAFVPTGTVLFVTTTRERAGRRDVFQSLADRVGHGEDRDKSASPSSDCGVPTR